MQALQAATQWDSRSGGDEAWPRAARHGHYRVYNEGTDRGMDGPVPMHGRLPRHASQANMHSSEQHMQEHRDEQALGLDLTLARGRAPSLEKGRAPPGSFIDDGVLFMDVSSDPSKGEEGRGSASPLGGEHDTGDQDTGATARMESQERKELVQSAARIAGELRDAGSNANGTVDR